MGEGYLRNLGKLDYYELNSIEYEFFFFICFVFSFGFIRYFSLLIIEVVNCLKWVFFRYFLLKDVMVIVIVVRGRCMFL